MLKKGLLISLFLLSSLFADNVDRNSLNENKTIYLSLDSLIKEVLKRNGESLKKSIELDISKAQVNYEKGIYDPVFSSNFIRQATNMPNSVENELVRFQETYNDQVNFFDMGVNGLISSGANWSLTYANNKKRSSLIEQNKDYDKEYDTSVKLELSQPLLKGFGKDITETKIVLSQYEQEIAQNLYKQKLMELQGLTIQTYWKLYGAQKIYKSWDKSIKVAEKSLVDLEARVRSGKIAETEVLDAKSSLNIRKSEYENAKNKFSEAQNQVLILLNLSQDNNSNFTFEIINNPTENLNSLLSLQEYTDLVLVEWPEYQNAKKNIQKEMLQKEYYENQLLPKLDLVGSVERTSLQTNRENSYEHSLDPEFTNWSAGLKFSMPLSNEQAENALQMANLKLKRSKLELETLENNLVNSIQIKIDNVNSSKKQYALYKEGLEYKEHLLEVENDKLQFGKVKVSDIFEKEEDYMTYQRKFLSSIIEWKTSEALLEISTGNLLKKYNIEIDNIQYENNNEQSIYNIFTRN